MTVGLVHIKTEKGRVELAGRSRTLTPLQRRVLILVDGHKTPKELEAFVRVGELDGTMAQLLGLGLIEVSPPPAQTFSASTPSASGISTTGVADHRAAAISPDEFKKVRSQASHYVSDQLGAAGVPICLAIDRCDNPAELRKLLRGVEIFIGQRLSLATTQAFARHFGSLLL